MIEYIIPEERIYISAHSEKSKNLPVTLKPSRETSICLQPTDGVFSLRDGEISPNVVQMISYGKLNQLLSSRESLAWGPT